MDGSFQQPQEQQEQQEWLAQGHEQHVQHKLKHEKELNMNDINDMSFDTLVPTDSKYLRKEDVGEDGVILTIKGFAQETINGDDGDELKIVMHFNENYNPMIVNKTNSQLIPLATGATKTGEAVGKEIVVYNDPTIAFGGKITGGLRIKKLQGAPKQAAKAPDISDVDSDIPFSEADKTTA